MADCKTKGKAKQKLISLPNLVGIQQAGEAGRTYELGNTFLLFQSCLSRNKTLFMRKGLQTMYMYEKNVINNDVIPRFGGGARKSRGFRYFVTCKWEKRLRAKVREEYKNPTLSAIDAAESCQSY